MEHTGVLVRVGLRGVEWVRIGLNIRMNEKEKASKRLWRRLECCWSPQILEVSALWKTAIKKEKRME